jgi:hypothetical protein
LTTGGSDDASRPWGRFARSRLAIAWLARRRGHEGVVGDFGADFGVAADDEAELLGIHHANHFGWQILLIPETVSITESGELIDQDAMESLTDHGTVAILLGETTDPEINVSRASVGGLKFFDDLTAMIHIFEVGDGT